MSQNSNDNDVHSEGEIASTDENQSKVNDRKGRKKSSPSRKSKRQQQSSLSSSSNNDNEDQKIKDGFLIGFHKCNHDAGQSSALRLKCKHCGWCIMRKSVGSEWRADDEAQGKADRDAKYAQEAKEKKKAEAKAKSKGKGKRGSNKKKGADSDSEATETDDEAEPKKADENNDNEAEKEEMKPKRGRKKKSEKAEKKEKPKKVVPLSANKKFIRDVIESAHIKNNSTITAWEKSLGISINDYIHWGYFLKYTFNSDVIECHLDLECRENAIIVLMPGGDKTHRIEASIEIEEALLGTKPITEQFMLKLQKKLLEPNGSVFSANYFKLFRHEASLEFGLCALEFQFKRELKFQAESEKKKISEKNSTVAAAVAISVKRKNDDNDNDGESKDDKSSEKKSRTKSPEKQNKADRPNSDVSEKEAPGSSIKSKIDDEKKKKVKSSSSRSRSRSRSPSNPRDKPRRVRSRSRSRSPPPVPVRNGPTFQTPAPKSTPLVPVKRAIESTPNKSPAVPSVSSAIRNIFQ